jgi:pyruvate/oxaloacetate carboxyltransferase
MIQLKRQLYTALSHIFEVLESPNIESIVSPIDFTQYNQNTRFALKSDEQFDLNFQIQFLKAKGCVEVEVLESDIATQKALLQGGMRFYTVAKLSNQKVADAMQKEMNQIQRKP